MFGIRSRNKQDDEGKPLEAVIAGGGVAALEAALGLQHLAGARVHVTLVAPTEEFVYRPMTVVEPFVDKTARRLPLASVASEIGAAFHQGSMVSVDPDRRVLVTDTGELGYDALVIAVGAKHAETLPGAVTLDPARMDECLRPVMDDIAGGAVQELALVAPSLVWPLPVYEMALYIRAIAADKDIDLGVTIITAEETPAEIFGAVASAGVAEVLAGAGIETVLGATATMGDGALRVEPGARELRFDRIVAFPTLEGPAIAGLPASADGFLATDARGEVAGAADVYAAGDATDFPVKFGGISAHQADVVAASIAELAGAPASPAPGAATLHGTLLTGPGRPPAYLSATLENDVVRNSTFSDTPTSPLQAKVAARYLGPYLDDRWASGVRWLASQLEWEPVQARANSTQSG